jgi:hypothetical protein
MDDALLHEIVPLSVQGGSAWSCDFFTLGANQIDRDASYGVQTIRPQGHINEG